MVYSSGAGYGNWGGVSGVPGLGVSIPAQARPGSSSAGDVGSDVAWDNAGKSRLQVPFLDTADHASSLVLKLEELQER